MATIETDNLENFMNEMRAFLDKQHWEECRGPSAMRELQNLKVLFERASRAVDDANAAVESARKALEKSKAEMPLNPAGNMDKCVRCGHPRIEHGIIGGCDHRWNSKLICLCSNFREVTQP